jgi:hypothetical protein
MSRAIQFVALCLLLASCATQSGMREALLNRATFDLGCEREKLATTELNSANAGATRVFGVSGCDKKATYIVQGDGVNGYQVVLNSDLPGQK